MPSDSPFLQACRRKKAPHTPIWLMRQIGRYMKEYRDVRERVGFLELCKSPELVTEVTVTAVEKIGADAAIIFSDILVVLEPMGFSLEFQEGRGPVIHNPFRGKSDIRRLRAVDPGESLAFLPNAIRMTRSALPAHLPVIGFAGAPFTLCAYAIEGGSSKDFAITKRLMRTETDAWNELMGRMADAVSAFLGKQIEAGAEAVQLFDSWVGCLSEADYRSYVLPHVKRVFASLPAEVPAIHFGTGTGLFLEAMKEAGGSVIGVDFRIGLADAWRRLGDTAIQGNLDPTVLLCPPETIEKEAGRILREANRRPGHIFNLGHGVLPSTPVDHVRRLVDFVHETTSK